MSTHEHRLTCHVNTYTLSSSSLRWLQYPHDVMMVTISARRYDGYNIQNTLWWLQYPPVVMMVTISPWCYYGYNFCKILWWLQYPQDVMMVTISAICYDGYNIYKTWLLRYPQYVIIVTISTKRYDGLLYPQDENVSLSIHIYFIKINLWSDKNTKHGKEVINQISQGNVLCVPQRSTRML
jgi:hypothetical protein